MSRMRDPGTLEEERDQARNDARLLNDGPYDRLAAAAVGAEAVLQGFH